MVTTHNVRGTEAYDDTDDTRRVKMAGTSAFPEGSFTRPADTTAYASGDLVANSVTAGSVLSIPLAVARANGGTGMIRRARLKKTSPVLTSASFRVHFYKVDPVSLASGVANGDNAAWSTKEATYLGSVDITMDRAFTDYAKGLGAPNVGSEINFETVADSMNVYALIEARAAYTPISGEVFTLTLEVLQD